MSERSDKRTSISLASVIWEMAEDQMRAKGFNENFSSYIADLIRRDRERLQYTGQIHDSPAPTPPAAPVNYGASRAAKRKKP